MTAVVLWDIDGTLLTTARAGVIALEDAAREVLGVQASLDDLRTAGLTDAQVAAAAIDACGAVASPESIDAFLSAYERRLPERLHARRGSVLPGVVEILEDLDRRDDVTSLLLTGNTPAGARAKLAHYGLERYFSDGAFCVEGADRETIARRAHELALRYARDGARQSVFVVGDTPHDVRAGDAIGARTVAVATGGYSLAELQACDPWLALEALPAPDEFAERLGLARD